MRKFNLASRAPNTEGEDPDTTIDVPGATPPDGGGKTRRLLVIVGALVVVAAAGYIALTQFTGFMAPKPAPPARLVRPIAKGPGPTPGTPPAGSATPAKPGAPPTSATTVPRASHAA